jgi:hypothetical protein
MIYCSLGIPQQNQTMFSSYTPNQGIFLLKFLLSPSILCHLCFSKKAGATSWGNTAMVTDPWQNHYHQPMVAPGLFSFFCKV